jgi:hypothetical protein
MEIELLLAGWLLSCCLSTNLPCNSHALKQGKVREGIHVLVFYTCTYIGRICRVPRHRQLAVGKSSRTWCLFRIPTPFPSFLDSSINTPTCLTSRQESIHGFLGHCGCIRALSTYSMLSSPSRRIAEGCEAYPPRGPITRTPQTCVQHDM